MDKKWAVRDYHEGDEEGNLELLRRYIPRGNTIMASG